MLHYAIQRAYSPVLVSSFEDPAGLLHLHLTTDLPPSPTLLDGTALALVLKPLQLSVSANTYGDQVHYC